MKPLNGALEKIKSYTLHMNYIVYNIIIAYSLCVIIMNTKYVVKLTSWLSQPIISPKETWWQKQYVGSLGSTGMSSTSVGCLAPAGSGAGLVRPDGLEKNTISYTYVDNNGETYMYIHKYMYIYKFTKTLSHMLYKTNWL